MKSKTIHKLVFWAFVALTLFSYVYTMVGVVSNILKLF